MGKKIFKIVAAVVLIVVAIGAWLLLGSGTGFSEKKRYLYIASNATTEAAVMDSIARNDLVANKAAFRFLANRMGYWQAVRPGRYEISRGASLVNIVRMLRNGRQSPVDLVINKFRTKADFARYTAARFEFDSVQMMDFLTNEKSLQEFDAEPQTALWRVLPDKYEAYWNTTAQALYQKLAAESKRFWNEERKSKATALGLTPQQAYTLASIVEEETNALEEKDTIASVYLNRLRDGMPLGADPTIRFALNDFSITRVYGDMLKVASPYNTYQTRGLPPGPICIPSKKTIDEVLKAPATNYFFFVASDAFNGTHRFSHSYAEHLQKAKAYQAEYKRRYGG